jgi:Na+-translocating ferredoxin:NAD+ oxidoreductase RnfG subunit
MILQIVAAVALTLLSGAGITFLVAHAIEDYKSKSEVTKRILEQYMLNHKLKQSSVLVPKRKKTEKKKPELL